jgi:predicted ATPase
MAAPKVWSISCGARVHQMQEPRIVTLLVTDVEASTSLLGSLGDAFVALIERQRAILTGAADARKGSGYSTGGDGCAFIFGLPGDAVATAVEAQRALAAEPWPGGTSVRVRMAIHAGEVAEVGDERFSVALRQASQMLAVSYGGQIVVSDAAVRLIGQLALDISLVDLGVHRLRDIVRPVRLHQAVADGIPTSFPPLSVATTGTGRLPAQTTSFIGRDRELRALVDLLGARRLVTLTGTGGSGKTRLALEAASRVEDQHRDGVCLVELAGLGTDALVPEAVIGALGMGEPTEGRSTTEFLCASLAERDLLLVLDNCEHVVAGVAAVANELLRTCPKLHVLATSREPLRLQGEVERPVPPLDRPDPAPTESLERLADYDAVRLLVERGGDVRPGFRLTDGNSGAVARICAALEGLPLAIELAAARLRTLSPEQVAARLGEQLDLLTHGERSRPDRQQTMRATFDWSHQLLAPDEQIVFRRLSVFAGGFTLDAAERVADGDGVDRAAVSDAVERLASRSLVAIDHDRAEPRLRMLEPVRQYAGERLRDAGEGDRVVRRHLEWVVSLSAEAGAGFVRDQRRWSARLGDEQDNIRQAMESALAVDSEAALRIAAALGHPWYREGQPGARAWVERALEAAPGASDFIRAMALWGAGMLAENALDYDRALVHLREALAMSRAVGARAVEGWVLMALGRAAWVIDVDARPPAAWFEDGLRIFREVDEPAGIGWMLTLLADEQLKADDIEGTAARAAEVFDVGTRSGLHEIVAQSRRLRAVVAARQGREADAEQLLKEAASTYEQAGDRWHLALMLTTMAHLAVNRGDDARALGPLRQALRLARDSGSGERMIYAVELASYVVLRRRREPDGATLLGAVDAVYLRLAPKEKETDERSRAFGWMGNYQLGLGASLEALALRVSAEFAEHRVAGRSLSLERAADLALRILDEELALAARPAGSVGEPAGVAPPAQLATSSDDARVFHRDGEYWTLAYAGQVIRLRDTKGLQYIARLLAAPGTEVHVADLVARGDGADDGGGEIPGPLVQGNLGTVLDGRARAEYKGRLGELREDLEEATRMGDLGRAAHARHEIEQITQELTAAYGLGGRPRTAGEPAERWRKAVTNQIRRTLERIRAGHPGLGRHLDNALRTGVFCSYVPERPISWRL